MKTFTPETFDIPELKGISKKSIDEHIGLYQGYVKNWNSLSEQMMTIDMEKFPHAISEMLRRASFEFGGMRLHEIYFRQFEGGATPLTAGSALEKKILEKSPVEKLVTALKNIAAMRGPGWALLYYDPVSDQLLTGFSGEQHQGHFVTLPVILALDVWEHTYILDYGAAGKGKYVDAFFENLNWSVVEKNFLDAQAGANVQK